MKNKFKPTSGALQPSKVNTGEVNFPSVVQIQVKSVALKLGSDFTLAQFSEVDNLNADLFLAVS